MASYQLEGEENVKGELYNMQNWSKYRQEIIQRAKKKDSFRVFWISTIVFSFAQFIPNVDRFQDIFTIFFDTCQTQLSTLLAFLQVKVQKILQWVEQDFAE